MKELSIEEKAKRYNEAMKKLRTMRDAWNNLETDYSPKDVVHDIEYYFPELAESEGGIKDERIRKAVISTFKPHCSFYEVSVDEVLAWFEKRFSKSRQKEIDDAYLKGVCDAKHELEKQGEQKPAEWNKNDEVLLDETLHFIREFQRSDRCINEGDMQNSVTCENWLKSLRPQPTWKPSKEQISVLSRSLKYINTISLNYCHVLGELLNQLKKLRKE